MLTSLLITLTSMAMVEYLLQNSLTQSREMDDSVVSLNAPRSHHGILHLHPEDQKVFLPRFAASIRKSWRDGNDYRSAFEDYDRKYNGYISASDLSMAKETLALQVRVLRHGYSHG